MSSKWSKVLIEILKYSVGVVCGALGINLVGGCASVPCFIF